MVFWLLLGLGFQKSFSFPAAGGESINYLEYLFPGTIALMILFTAIFSTISIVEERKSGFLQAALIAPEGGIVAGMADPQTDLGGLIDGGVRRRHDPKVVGGGGRSEDREEGEDRPRLATVDRSRHDPHRSCPRISPPGLAAVWMLT